MQHEQPLWNVQYLTEVVSVYKLHLSLLLKQKSELEKYNCLRESEQVFWGYFSSICWNKLQSLPAFNIFINLQIKSKD